jgi:hypothetical protein
MQSIEGRHVNCLSRDNFLAYAIRKWLKRGVYFYSFHLISVGSFISI